MIEAIALVAAGAFIVVQHVVIRRLERGLGLIYSAVCDVANGKATVFVSRDGDVRFKLKERG